MSKTVIAIPSYGRFEEPTNKFRTFSWIPYNWLNKTRFYVEPEEIGDYRNYVGKTGAKLFLASNADYPKKWGSIMDLIIDQCCEEFDHLVIMDDDLALAYRPNLPQEPTKFSSEFTASNFNSMMNQLKEITTEESPLCSTQYRQFSQGKTQLIQHNQRISMIWSINCKFFRENKQYRFYRQSKLDFMTDYYFFLNLLCDGYPNKCLNSFTKDDKPNAPGGESSKRDIRIFNKAVKEFQAYFPNYVTVREKKGVTNWRDGMLGVTIQAKKAYTDSQRKIPARQMT